MLSSCADVDAAMLPLLEIQDVDVLPLALDALKALVRVDSKRTAVLAGEITHRVIGVWRRYPKHSVLPHDALRVLSILAAQPSLNHRIVVGLQCQCQHSQEYIKNKFARQNDARE